MVRPLPQHPWGRRPLARQKVAGERLVLEVPLESPQRTLHAHRAFIKPHDWTREAIRHRLETDASRGAEQRWEETSAEALRQVATEAAGRLGLQIELEAPPELHARIAFPANTPAGHIRALAAASSVQLPETWFVLGRLAVLGGRFYRRERGYRLHLRPAGGVHLPRDVRILLRDLLRPRGR